MQVAVIRFPGSNCDDDVLHVLQHAVPGMQARFVFHKETELGACDAVVLPGGFSYGDYLRAGAMAAHSPAMGAVRRFAAAGGPVLGICNGFQILCEAGLLEGALVRNASLHFECRDVHVVVEGRPTPWTGRFRPAGFSRCRSRTPRGDISIPRWSGSRPRGGWCSATWMSPGERRRGPTRMARCATSPV